MILKFNFEGKEFEYDTETCVVNAENELMQKILSDNQLGTKFLREIRKKMPEPSKLNIGCGYRPKMDFINLDYDPIVNPDMVRDISEGLPFDSDKFEEIYSSHVIEHVKDVLFFMYEIWRVSKNKARIEILAPYSGFLEWALQPDHLRLMNWGFFDRWKPEWRSVQNEDKQCRGAKFNVIKEELFNEAREIRYILEAVK